MPNPTAAMLVIGDEILRPGRRRGRPCKTASVTEYLHRGSPFCSPSITNRLGDPRPFVNRRLIRWRAESNMCLNSDIDVLYKKRSAMHARRTGGRLRASSRAAWRRMRVILLPPQRQVCARKASALALAAAVAKTPAEEWAQEKGSRQA